MRRTLALIVVLLSLPTTAAHAQAGAVSVGNASAGESAGVVRVAISLSQVPAEPVEVTWRTGPATFIADAPSAIAGTDYVAASGTLTFAAGERTKDVEITLIDDAADDSGGYFAVFAGIAQDPPPWFGGLIEVIDDDPTPAPSIADARVRENAGHVSLQVTRPGVTGRGTMRWAWTVQAESATLGRDVVAASGVVTLWSAETATTISVPLLDDADDEPDEIFLVAVTPLPPTTWGEATGERPADGVAAVTITDDDPAPAAQDPIVQPRFWTVRLRPAGARNWLVLRGPTAAAAGTLVDASRGTADLGGTLLAGGVFEVRSAREVVLAGGRRARCGHRVRALTVRGRPGLLVRGRRARAAAAAGPARWTIADGCRGTTVRVLSGRVTVTGAGRTSTLRRGERRLVR